MIQNVCLGFRESDLNTDFFKRIVDGLDPGSGLVNWTEHEFDSGSNGIITALLGDQSSVGDKRILGFRCFTLEYTDTNLDQSRLKQTRQKTVVLKSKATGRKIAEIFRDACRALGGDIARGYDQYYQQMGLLNGEHRDVLTLTVDVPQLSAIRPTIHHHVYEPDREVFVYVMDDFRSKQYTHLDAVDKVWSQQEIADVLRGMAGLHARFHGRTSDVPTELAKWLDNAHTMTHKPELQFIWQAMAEETHKHLPHLVDAELLKTLR